METMKGFLDMGNRVAYFVVEGHNVEIPVDPAYPNDDICVKLEPNCVDSKS